MWQNGRSMQARFNGIAQMPRKGPGQTAFVMRDMGHLEECCAPTLMLLMNPAKAETEEA